MNNLYMYWLTQDELLVTYNMLQAPTLLKLN